MNRIKEFLVRLRHEPMGIFGLVLVLLVVLCALFAPFLVIHDPNALDIAHRLTGPSADHWMGTDQLGRDVFSRVVMGSRIAVWVALVTVSLSLCIGLVLGMMAGYGPKWLDSGLLLVFDTLRSFPTIMFALALVTVFGPSLQTVIIVIVATTFPVYGRMVRTQTQALVGNEFIVAEEAMGAGMMRVLGVHILPNIVGPLFIVASMDIPVVITIEAGLSFLGVGVRPPTPSWGAILNDGYAYIRNTPWIIIFGGIPLVVTTLGFTFLGESMRDMFDPKLRKDL